MDERSTAQEVTLRNVDAADLPTLFAFESEPSANEMALATPRTPEDFDAHWKKILDAPSVTALAVVVDGVVAGSVVSFEMETERYVGYWIGEAFWGRGIATEALRQLMDHLTGRPLFARVSPSNVASIRVLEKCGFELSRREWEAGNARFREGEVLVMVLV